MSNIVASVRNSGRGSSVLKSLTTLWRPAASATRLFQILSANSDAFTRYLRPGLPRDAIQRRLSDAGLPLPPDDVLEFYGSFDLVHHHQYEPEQPSFYGIYRRLSFDDAVELWLERRSYDFLEPRWREAFPILQEDGNAFAASITSGALPGGSPHVPGITRATGIRLQVSPPD